MSRPAPPTREQWERLCMGNLLADPAARIWFKDRASRFLFVSAGYAAALGRGARPEDLIGKTDVDIFSTPHAAAALADERRIMRTGEPVVDKLERETFEDERPDAWVSTAKLPLRDGDGPDHRHLGQLPRRHRPARGGARARPPVAARRADGAAEPAAGDRPGRADAGPGAAPPRASPSSTSTSTASSRSTTGLKTSGNFPKKGSFVSTIGTHFTGTWDCKGVIYQSP